MTLRRLSHPDKTELKNTWIHTQIFTAYKNIYKSNQTKSQHEQGKAAINSQYQTRNFSHLLTMWEEKPGVLFWVFVFVKRHYDHGNSYKEKNLIGVASLQCHKFSPLSSWQGAWWQVDLVLE